MATVADILMYVESIAPPYMKYGWDNVGLLCGRRNREVKKILVALDPFRNVIDEAICIGADLIVTHHPLIFGEEIKAVNEDTETGRCLLTLMEQGIAAINAHTNLDMAPGGINDVLADALGLADIQVLNPEGSDEAGNPYGLLRSGIVREQPLQDFLAHVKEALDCQGLRYVNGAKPVCHVAVGGGSCADMMVDALAKGCDTFVTADVKYNFYLEAKQLGINLMDAGHYATENVVCSPMAEYLKAQFSDVEVILSEDHRESYRAV